MTEISTRLDEARQRLRSTPRPSEHLFDPPAPYLTVKQAAALAQCSEKTIRRAIRSGRLRAFKPTTRVLLREEDVRAWIESEPAPERAVPPQGRRSRQRPQPGSVASLRELERSLG